MRVKLKVLHGTLKNKQGANVGLMVDVHAEQFVIGSAEDANMRCPSKTISPRHCAVTRNGDRIMLADLGSETGTFVNDERITDSKDLQHGDRLRVGRLEFEVEIVRSPLDHAARPHDPVDDYISDLLVEGDEQARARRLEDPEARQYHLEPAPSNPQETGPQDEDKKRIARPPKKPPGKLPPPPKYTAENTVEAAEETLKKIFEKQKR